MGTAVVDHFYRVAFSNERSFWHWTERVVEFAAVVRHIFVDRSDLRPVIFAPQWPEPGTSLRAYVSVGALGVAIRMSEGVLIDRSTVISAAQLPAGLAMLLGDELDETEYERRQAWRHCTSANVS